MERKQAIALTIMAAWILFNWQSGTILYFNEDLIIEDILRRSNLDPGKLKSNRRSPQHDSPHLPIGNIP